MEGRWGAAARGFPLALCAVLLLLTASAGLAGCGSRAADYARQARSSYISARAVLVGVEEFPAQMEALLRSGDISAVAGEAGELIADARGLLPSASSAFRSARENAELLKGAGSEKFVPYADDLLELAGLNEEVVKAYSEYIALSNSVLQGLPYRQDPQALMPTLNYMDEVIKRIQELGASIERLEGEAETLYRELTK